MNNHSKIWAKNHNYSCDNNYKKTAGSIKSINPKQKTKKCVLVVEKSQLLRNSLIQSLQKLSRDLYFCGGTTETLHEIASPDLILLSTRSTEYEMCGAPVGFQQVRAMFPDVPMMILSDNEDVQQATWAIQHDVKGYFPASLSIEILIASIRLIFAGGTFVPADMVISGLSRNREEQGADKAPLLEMRVSELAIEEFNVCDLDHGTFTDREAEVVSLLRCGETNKVIARKLDISPSTVKVHVHNIMSKLNARNRTQVVHLLDNLLRQQAHRGAVPL